VTLFRAAFGLFLLAVMAGCSNPIQRQLRLPNSQPAGALGGRIVLEGRIPAAAVTGRYRVVVLRGGKLVVTEGMGTHDTYSWLLPAGTYSVELFGKLLAPDPLVKTAVIRTNERTSVNFVAVCH